MYLSANLIVFGFTAYFFYKVLVTPHGHGKGEQPEPPVKSYDVS